MSEKYEAKADRATGVSERGAANGSASISASIVDSIIKDLQGRAGLGDEWDYEIDSDIRGEIREKWIALTTEALEANSPEPGRGPPPAACGGGACCHGDVERSDASVRSGGAVEWKKIVDEAIDVRLDGKIRMWTRGLERDSKLAAVMTPDEAEELARALQLHAISARKVLSDLAPEPRR